jgi:hypothetical protein
MIAEVSRFHSHAFEAAHPATWVTLKQLAQK